MQHGLEKLHHKKYLGKEIAWAVRHQVGLLRPSIVHTFMHHTVAQLPQEALHVYAKHTHMIRTSATRAKVMRVPITSRTCPCSIISLALQHQG